MNASSVAGPTFRLVPLLHAPSCLVQCVVTISHFSPYGMDNGQALVNDMLQNPDIDILSPQLYTSGFEPDNDWTGYSDAWRNSIPAVAPSIVQAYYYDQLGANSVTSYLPASRGYFVWANTPPTPPPGPGTDCVRWVLKGGVDWCERAPRFAWL